MLSPRSYEAPSSVWEIVCQFSAPSEHHELKTLIGEDLIDQTHELREEIQLLQELAMDMSDEADSRSASQAAGHSRLPEPPQMRERLTQEIVFFLESIREQAKQQTGSDAVNLRKLDVSPDVVDYAYESSSSRPSTGTSRLSLGEIRVTPCSSRCGSRTARSDSASADVAQMREQLTYMRCDEVRRLLRQYLEEELEQLKEDLAVLQSSLSLGPAPADRCSREPSLADLRLQRHKLESALFTNSRQLPALRSHHQPMGSGAVAGCHSNKAANATIPRQQTPTAAAAATATAATAATTTAAAATAAAAAVAGGEAARSRLSSAQRLRSLVQQSRQSPPVLAHVD